MTTTSIKQTILARAARTLTGARRVAAVLLVMLFSMTAQTAWAVRYYDPTADAGSQTKTADATQINDETRELGTDGDETWYCVSGDVAIDDRIEVHGTVNIILVNGCDFTVEYGIKVGSGNTLNIYAQKRGVGCGKLTVGNNFTDAAIGGNGGGDYTGRGGDGADSGTINIFGGHITAYGTIGGGEGGGGQESDEGEGGIGGNGGSGTVSIYGGTIYVEGTIGGGKGGGGDNYDGIDGVGTVTLSWTNSSDRIYAEQYNGKITLQKDFVDDNGYYKVENWNVSKIYNSNRNNVCPLNEKSLQPDVTTYDVIVSDSSDPTCLDADVIKAAEGEVVTLTPVNGYNVTSVTAKGADNDDVNVTPNNNDGTWTFTMPAKDVTVTPTATRTHYPVWHADDVTLNDVDDSYKLVQNGDTYYKPETTISFTVTPQDATFVLSDVSVYKTEGGDEIEWSKSGDTYSFEMPAAEVTVSPSWTRIASKLSKEDNIDVSTDAANIVRVNGEDYYKPGSEITVTVSPGEGKVVHLFSVRKDEDNSSVSFTDNGNNSYTFTMPGANVTVKAICAIPVNFTWTFTDEDNDGIDETLTISGTCAIPDFDDWGDRPWNSILDDIKTVVIGNGITAIGKNAFFCCENLTDVSIPSSVTNIGESAFDSSGNLATITIPASVTSLGTDAFYWCTSVTDVYCYADPTKLTWNENGEDFITDTGNSNYPTKCHVFDESTWTTNFGGNVNVVFVDDLGTSTCPVVLTEGDGVDLLTSLAAQTTRTDVPENLNVTFSRTFDASTNGTGKASTVCLPYAVAKPDDAVGTFYTFGGVTEDQGEYTVTMNEMTDAMTTPGTPYLFKPADGGAVPFSGTIAIAASYATGEPPSTNGWEFHGTYEKKTWESGQTRLYGFAAADFEKSDGTLLNDVGAFRRFDWGYCDAFRCYLWAPDPNAARGATKSGSALPQSMRVILVSASGETTAVGTLDTRTGEVTFDGEAWYSLDGRRLNGKPNAKGMYIHNGKTVVIKD